MPHSESTPSKYDINVANVVSSAVKKEAKSLLESIGNKHNPKLHLMPDARIVENRHNFKSLDGFKERSLRGYVITVNENTPAKKVIQRRALGCGISVYFLKPVSSTEFPKERVEELFHRSLNNPDYDKRPFADASLYPFAEFNSSTPKPVLASDSSSVTLCKKVTVGWDLKVVDEKDLVRYAIVVKTYAEPESEDINRAIGEGHVTMLDLIKDFNFGGLIEKGIERRGIIAHGVAKSLGMQLEEETEKNIKELANHTVTIGKPQHETLYNIITSSGKGRISFYDHSAFVHLQESGMKSSAVFSMGAGNGYYIYSKDNLNSKSESPFHVHNHHSPSSSSSLRNKNQHSDEEDDDEEDEEDEDEDEEEEEEEEGVENLTSSNRYKGSSSHWNTPGNGYTPYSRERSTKVSSKLLKQLEIETKKQNKHQSLSHRSTPNHHHHHHHHHHHQDLLNPFPLGVQIVSLDHPKRPQGDVFWGGDASFNSKTDFESPNPDVIGDKQWKHVMELLGTVFANDCVRLENVAAYVSSHYSADVPLKLFMEYSQSQLNPRHTDPKFTIPIPPNHKVFLKILNNYETIKKIAGSQLWGNIMGVDKHDVHHHLNKDSLMKLIRIEADIDEVSSKHNS